MRKLIAILILATGLSLGQTIVEKNITWRTDSTAAAWLYVPGDMIPAYINFFGDFTDATSVTIKQFRGTNPVGADATTVRGVLADSAYTVTLGDNEFKPLDPDVCGALLGGIWTYDRLWLQIVLDAADTTATGDSVGTAARIGFK